MSLTINMPDLSSASDEDMRRMFPSFDGRWSEQTLGLLSAHKTTLLSLNDNWASVPQNWFCPACSRYKADLVRLSSQGVLLCRLHWHHDHLRDHGEKILRRGVPVLDTPAARAVQFSAVAVCKTMAERFHEMLVCEDCNTADGRAKQLLKGTIHPAFSFAPTEITQFIQAAANRAHEIDQDKALILWEAAAEDIADRLAFMTLLAKRVTNGCHVKEGSNYQPNRTVALLADCATSQDPSSSSVHNLRHEFSYRSTQDDAAGTSLKPKARPRVRIPTEGDLEAFNATQNPDSLWWAGGKDWRCAGCDRNRFEMLRISKAGEWTASAHRRAIYHLEDRPEALHFRHGWYGASLTYRCDETVYICKDCRQIISDTKMGGTDLTDDCLSIVDLRAVLTDVQPHRRLEYDKAAAITLVAENTAHVSAVKDLYRHQTRRSSLASQRIQMCRAGWSDEETIRWQHADMNDDHLDASEYLALLNWLLAEADAGPRHGK